MSDEGKKTREKGWWYPLVIVGAFAVIIPVNLTMAYFATSTFTGLETKDAYLKGIAYNQNLAMAKAQKELGWKVETSLAAVPDQPGPTAKIVVRYTDRDGKPVEGLDVNALVIRPTTAGHDHQIHLDPMGQGSYGGVYPLPLKGQWSFDIAATGDSVAYQYEKRVVIP